jgi:hypothetical protein
LEACNDLEGATMTHRFHCAAFTLVLLLAMTSTVPCVAQNTPAPPTLDPKACSDEQRLRLPNGTALQSPDPQSPDPSNRTLSEKLARSEGVLCPPAGVDPEIAQPPPGGGRTPVIPPPGSPGGDPTERPK